MKIIKKYRKLGCKTDLRKAMIRNLTTNLFWHGEIKTTVARAKEVSRCADKLITIAKKHCSNDINNIDKKKDNANKLNARRKLLAFFYTPKEIPDSKHKKKYNKINLAQKTFDEIAPKYLQRNGGYTRVIKIGFRRGDAAEMAILQFV